MKAVIQTGVGDAEKHSHGDMSVIKVTNVDKPVAPESGQVLLKVHAASLNPVDVKRTIMKREGEEANFVVGYDAAGVIEAVGPDVSDFSVGDRVFGDIVAKSLASKETGTLAEYALAPAHTLARIPERVSFTDAAALPVAALTGLQALKQAGARSGQTLFVTAGSGGVGLHTIQIAKALFGISQVAVTASRSSEELVKKYGADIVIDYHTQDAAQVLKAWADIVIDCTGETQMEKEVAKEGAKLMTIVFAGGDEFTNIVCEPCSEDIATVADLLEKGSLIPVIDSVYGFEDVEKAIEHSISGHAKGKIVVKIVDE